MGEEVWQREIEWEDWIESFDGPVETKFGKQRPFLHHLRSSNVETEQLHLQHCGKESIERRSKIYQDSRQHWHVDFIKFLPFQQ